MNKCLSEMTSLKSFKYMRASLYVLNLLVSEEYIEDKAYNG